ncbi:MAG: response regulator transcription factor [Candidatus Nanopelagicales bacterium]
MTERGLVLVVEDEKPISDLLRMYLQREGYTVHAEFDGPGGLTAARTKHPAAVILDVGLPGMDGTEICRALRAEDDWVPVIFCTARDDEVDRVLGLELGADDYVTKPFSPREVVARVKSLVRRSALTQRGSETMEFGQVSVDPTRRRVTVAGKPIRLTATEFDLLAHLMSEPGRVFSRDQLLAEVWGYASVVGTRTVDVHVAQLRAKLGSVSPIRTVRGVGYSVDAET